jgi:acyl-coenzyme A thioesterase 13
MTGVSVNINTSFVRPGGRIGDILRARGTVTALGKSLAYTRVDFFDEKDQLVAYGGV